MKYDTESYWKSLHKQWAGRLRSVGHPWLSEEFNQLKYPSESAAFLVSLEEMRSGLPERKTLSILDVGVGTGYWTGVSANWCSKAGLQVDASAVDISEVALESVKSNFPSVETCLQDLRSVDVDMFSNTFDLVISCYCFTIWFASRNS